MTFTPEQIEAGAFAIYSAWARSETDPERRWKRVPDNIKNQFREEAKACAMAMIAANEASHEYV